MARQAVRKLRHWKQRWNKNAAFVWRRKIMYAGELTEPGSPIPEALAKAPTKLRRFWESHTIELAEFEAPDVATGQVEGKKPEPAGDDEVAIDPPIEGVKVTRGKGSWFIIDTGEDQVKVNGQAKLDELLAELRLEAEDGDQDGDGDGPEDEADDGSDEATDDAEGEATEETDGSDADAEDGGNAEPEAGDDFLD